MQRGWMQKIGALRKSAVAQEERSEIVKKNLVQTQYGTAPNVLGDTT